MKARAPFDKNFFTEYNTFMELYGKKQIDIREDNKSAVIDILLQRESTMLQMAERLGLSHTALAKVVNELRQKNVVQLCAVRDAGAGRPPKVFGVNGDCAIACAVLLTSERVYVYYVDMRGFQINKIDTENTFPDFASLLDFTVAQVHALKCHPRLEGKILKNIYIGIPSARMYGKTFADLGDVAQAAFAERFPTVRTVVRRNVDYETVAESKYGLLSDGKKNALFLNLDECFCASFFLGGSVYRGDHGMQGYDANDGFCGIKRVPDFAALAEKYAAGEREATEKVHALLLPAVQKAGALMRILDIGYAVLGGELQRLGDRFLEVCASHFGENKSVKYTVMGKDIPAALSGAVWQSTYATLQDVMVR